MEEIWRTSRLDERAWAVKYGFSSAPHLSEPNALAIMLMYKNTGKTPAKNTDVILGYASGVSPLKTNDYFPNNANTRGLIAPGAEGRSAIILPAKCVQEIRDGKPYYFYGTIWYDDIFGIHH